MVNSTPAIRQNADVATAVVEKHGNKIHPILRQAIDSNFRIDIAEKGELSVEFLQGFFSGLMFANIWLTDLGRESTPQGQCVADLTVEAARKYLERIEKEVNGV